MTFPDYSQLVTALAGRDSAIYLILWSVAVPILWLILAQRYYPRMLPVLRIVVLSVFFLSIPFFYFWRFR